MDKLLTIKDAAAYAHISERKLERLVKKGKIPAYKIGGSYVRFKKEDLDHFRMSFSKKAKPLTHHEKNVFFEHLKDFFYFNGFYIISIILAIVMLIIILKF
ncbi:MAG: helix-turn-helix domain-containing protein [Candidatus Omnitrophota bacterium]